MCYTIAQLKHRAYKHAVRSGANPDDIERLKHEWEEAQKVEAITGENYYMRGFDHPNVFAISNRNGISGEIFTWGLIPAWVKNQDEAIKLMPSTLLARCETIFDKPAFRSVKENRCVIMVDGYFEHHHVKGKTIPYFIKHIDENTPLIIAGIWSEWVNQETGEIKKTCALVTTEANKLLAKIHNNPKANGSRMLVALETEKVDTWLHANEKSDLEKLMVPCSDEILKAYPVGKLNGKGAMPDGPEVWQEVKYPELNIQTELF